MNLSTLFAKLDERKQVREQSAADAYGQLVSDLADGKELKADAVEAILERAGQTSDQLQEDVDLKQRRRAWAAKLEEEPAIRGRLAELAGEVESERGRFQELQRQHVAALETLRAEEQELQARLSAVDEARRQLAVTSPASKQQAAFVPQIQPIRRRIEGLERKRRQAQEHVNQAVRAEREGRDGSETDDVARLLGTAASQEKRLAKAADRTARERRVLAGVDAELAEARRELQAINDQVEELQEAAMAP